MDETIAHLIHNIKFFYTFHVIPIEYLRRSGGGEIINEIYQAKVVVIGG